MPAGFDKRSAAALFRLLAAQIGTDAIGIVATHPPPGRVLAATPALQRRITNAGPDQPPPHAATGTHTISPIVNPVVSPGASLPHDGPGRINPAEVGLDAAFVAAAPCGPGRWLIVADDRTRRLSGAFGRALADAAVLATPLFGATTPETQPARAPRTTGPVRAVRTRYAAQRVIESAFRGSRPAAEALMLVDIDRFRAVNEALGLAAGDALLAVTGSRLEQALAGKGRVVRLEGDRFIVVAPGTADDHRALARRLLAAISQPLVLDGRRLVMQASIGIVTAPSPDLLATDLLMQAEAALRRAKAEGHSRFVLHEPGQDTAASERSRIELDLGNALAHGQMHLAFQPYIDLRDGQPSGAEALLRWRHPTRGDIQPAAFIPAAETTGHILTLGTFVLHEALTRAAAWPDPMTLSVNISPLQFHQPGFLAQVDAALAATGTHPGRLELEITETVLMRDNPATIALLQALIGRGVRIALDDFGTGYSALAYLARLPHHRIKLDKGFVQDLANPATADLILAIIALARAQGVAVTAEGVERPEQLAQVRRAGFTHAQGYATGAPTPDLSLFPAFSRPALPRHDDAAAVQSA